MKLQAGKSILGEPRKLLVTDAASCCALSDEAGWNQTEKDWQFIISQSDACGIESESGQIVATTVAFTAGSSRWIAMVLVARDWRGHGLASKVLDKLTVGASPEKTDYLDATSLGAPLYRKRGFTGMGTVLRFRGTGDGSGRMPVILPEGIGYLSGSVPGLDSSVQACPWCPSILEYSRTASPGSCFVLDRKGGSGAIWVRPGRLAWQVGPLVATDAHIAGQLFGTCLRTLEGPVFVDVPAESKGMLSIVEQKGFTVAREFERMRCGPDVSMESTEMKRYATAGPDFG